MSRGREKKGKKKENLEILKALLKGRRNRKKAPISKPNENIEIKTKANDGTRSHTQ